MAAKGSKSRGGRSRVPARPGAEAQPPEAGSEKPPSTVEAEPQSIAPEERPAVVQSEAGPDAGPESPSPPEREGEDDSRRDESPAGDEEDSPPKEREQAATVPEPGEPEDREPWRYRITAGLAALLVVAGLAVAWLYGGDGDPGRLDADSQRLDQMAAQTEAQATRLGATEESIAGLRSELGQVSSAVTGLQTSLGDLQSAAEANRQQMGEVAQAVDALRNAAPADGPVGGEAVGELRSAIEALGERVAGLEPAGEAMAELGASIEPLDQRVSALEQGDQLAGLTASIARLEQELSDLRAEIAGRVEQAQDATALGQAYAALSERIAAGAPCADELQAVTARLPTAPSLETLSPLAGEGVPTILDLRARLGEIAAALPPDEPDDAAAADGVWQTMRQRLEGMVSVRRADEADWSAILVRANQALLRSDVAAAIAAVERAPDAPPAELEAWLADARMRRDAEAGLDELAAAVLRQFAGRR